jgi:hypothetical protein
LVEERQYLLNLFIKQLARCPYLVESEEFHLFIRPHIELEKALTLLPRLNFSQLIERTSKYYTFMGDISESKIQNQVNKILIFVKNAKALLQNLERFFLSAAKVELV